MKALLTTFLLLMSTTTWSTVICTAADPCGSYNEQAEATYIGSFDATTRDTATFQHAMSPGSAFEDFWVFDVNPDAEGSISADFTALASIENFTAALYVDGGSICDGVACSEVILSELVTESVNTESRFEILLKELNAGRYVIQITGAGNPRGAAYTGQAGFSALEIAEPGTALLMFSGLALVIVFVLFGLRQHRIKKDREKLRL